MRRVGEAVLVFTASGTFRGQRGVVTLTAPGSALVQLPGERTPLLFKDREMVPETEGAHLAGAE